MARMVRWIGCAAGLLLGAAVGAGGCDDESTATSTGGVGGGLLEDAGSISGLALINPTCGVGDGGTVSQDCVDCATANCSAQFVECFGADWQSSLAGGICTSFGQCVMDCDCGDNLCFNDCLAALDANVADPCRGCVVDLVACEQTHCDAQCDIDSHVDAGQGGTGVGGGNAGGHGHGSG